MSANINKLFEDNIPLAYYIVHNRYPKHSNDEDFIQTALLGLYKACKYYKSDISKFSTYATKVIMNELNGSLRRNNSYKRIINNYTTSIYDNVADTDNIAIIDTIQDNSNFATYLELIDNMSKLSEEDKYIITLKLYRLNQSDIGKILNMSQAKVSRKLNRIKNKIIGDD